MINNPLDRNKKETVQLRRLLDILVSDKLINKYLYVFWYVSYFVFMKDIYCFYFKKDIYCKMLKILLDKIR